MLRRWKDAETWCALGHSRFPNAWRFTFCRLTLLYMPTDQKPDAAAAWRLVAELERIAPPSEQLELDPRWRMMVAGVLARAGQLDSARHTLATAKAAAGEDPEMDFYEAGVRARLAEPEPALRLLERYLAYAPQVRPFIRGDPVFEPLHALPRFRALVGEP
jgi:hypothetical protein